jgi:type IV fimbrial biogenesis protein FimT
MTRGFTLVELLVTVAVAAVCVHLSLPGMRAFVETQRAVAACNSIISTIALARATAILRRVPVTLCPRHGDQCGRGHHWRDGGLIFADLNRNGRIDTGEAVLGALPALPAGAVLRWRSFRNRSHLTFLPTGLTAWQNGHFQYCPEDGDPRFARQLILNAAGRVRLARDADADGVVEDASGQPLSCAN